MSTFVEEEKKAELRDDTIYSHKVILFNDNHNNFDHVERCLIEICYKSEKEAKKIAMEAHTKGRSICYDGSLEVCETVSERMSAQDLTVSVE
ncbi:MAG: ATP-dependent Clp protease adaptor ClpS [Leptospiraceae bacterium]|nr:ATP-dependent Clp protease adaptor ClpS [Leptospiraceae bacterium]